MVLLWLVEGLDLCWPCLAGRRWVGRGPCTSPSKSTPPSSARDCEPSALAWVTPKAVPPDWTEITAASHFVYVENIGVIRTRGDEVRDRTKSVMLAVCLVLEMGWSCWALSPTMSSGASDRVRSGTGVSGGAPLVAPKVTPVHFSMMAGTLLGVFCCCH